MRTLAIAIFIVFFSSVALTQQHSQYVFTNLSTSNGLASNIVTSIVQDDKGYMWFATINGLQRYDGSRFMNFKSLPDNSATIPTNYLRGMFLDAKKRIWLIGNDNRVGIFNTERFLFKEYPVQSEKVMRTYVFKHFLQAPDGTLYLYEENGSIYRLDEKAKKFIPDDKSFKLPPKWPVKRITWDPHINKYWLTSDSGLIVYNPANKKLSYRNHNVENDPVIRHYEKQRAVINVVTDKDHVYFYAAPDIHALPLLHSYNRKTGKASILNPKDHLNVNYYEIHGLLQQKNGRLWANGVYMFSEWLPDQQAFLPVPNTYKGELSIKFNYANFSYEDREGNIWIATDNGLFRFNPDAQVFHSYSLIHVEEKNIIERGVLSMSMLQTKDSNIFIGTWGLGTFYFDRNFKPLPLPPALKVIEKNITTWDIFQHAATGKIWFTLQGGKGTVLVYDPKKQTTEWVTDKIFSGDGIRDITEDKWGNLWIGTLQGNLVKWNYQQVKGDVSKGFTLISKIGHARRMYTDWNGYIWAVTNNNGLLKIDPSKNKIIKHFTEDAPKGYQLTSNELCDILQHNDTTLIVAAGSINLINLRTNQVTHITTADGLPSNTAVSIQKDSRGILWFGMTSGLCRVNLEKRIFIPYDRRDGIPYDNFEPTRALKLNDGRLVFGTDQNVLSFDPIKAIQNDKPNPPTPTLTAFRLTDHLLMLDSLMQLEKVELQYDKSSIVIEFSNLSYLLQNKIHFYYMLEGLDKEWIRANEAGQAIYNYIPPGKYTFKVKSKNEDGVSSLGFATLNIEVKPPFWKTEVFYALISLIIIGIFYLIDKERLKRLKTVHEVRTQIAGDLHADIHTTLSDINVLSAMAKIKADKDIVRSKEYIEQISAKSTTMMESMGDILWSIDPNNDSMGKMLLRIHEYNDWVKSMFQTQVHLSTDSAVDKLILNMQSRHDFLMFYKLAIRYVIQQSHCDALKVSLACKRNRIHLEISAFCNPRKEPVSFYKNYEEELHLKADEMHADLSVLTNDKRMVIVLQIPL